MNSLNRKALAGLLFLLLVMAVLLFLPAQTLDYWQAWAFTAEAALRLSDGIKLSAAIVDYDLKSQTADDVCDWLRERHVPFLFYTAWTSEVIGTRWNGTPVIMKPTSWQALVAALEQVVCNSSEPLSN